MNDATSIAGFQARLDEVEDRLPLLPARWLHLNRVLSERTIAQVRRSNERVVDALAAVGRVADSGVRTVIGTARAAAEGTMSSAATGFRQVTGQAKAQAERTGSTLEDEVTDLTEDAIDRAEAGAERADRAYLRSLSKAELYDQAQDLDIDGRSTMSKGELVEALGLDLDARR